MGWSALLPHPDESHLFSQWNATKDKERERKPEKEGEGKKDREQGDPLMDRRKLPEAMPSEPSVLLQ